MSKPSLPKAEADGDTNLINFERRRRYLGVSRRTLLRYIYARRISAIKIANGWKFAWVDVDAFRKSQNAEGNSSPDLRKETSRGRFGESCEVN